MGRKKSISDKTPRNTVRDRTKMVQINFTIPEDDLKIWRQYADDLGFPLARVIKDIMNATIHKPKETERFQPDIQMQMLAELRDLKAEQSQLTQKYLQELDKSGSKEIENSDEIKIRIMTLLESGPMSREKLGVILGLDNDTIHQMLKDMNKSQTIRFDPNDQKWRLN